MFSHFLDSIPAGIFGCVLNPVEEENSLPPCSSANLFERGEGGEGLGRGAWPLSLSRIYIKKESRRDASQRDQLTTVLLCI
jgi:hypothetical protein